MKHHNSIRIMEKSIIDYLSTVEKGYGTSKHIISKHTDIPIDVLTVLLRRLKYKGRIELIMVWSEQTGQPNGSGYCMQGNCY